MFNKLQETKMKKLIVNLYQFKELSKGAKARAISEFKNTDDYYDDIRCALNFESEVDRFIESAKSIGFEIDPNEVEYNLDRGASCGVRKNGVSVIDDYFQKKFKLKKKPDIDLIIKCSKIGVWHEEFPVDRWCTSLDNSHGWCVVEVGNVDKATAGLVAKSVGDNIVELVEFIRKLKDTMFDTYDKCGDNAYIAKVIQNRKLLFREDGHYDYDYQSSR